MKQKSNTASKLIKGKDYIYENGFVVLTREYLLKRGFCCESGCKNCPYGFKKAH